MKFFLSLYCLPYLYVQCTHIYMVHHHTTIMLIIQWHNHRPLYSLLHCNILSGTKDHYFDNTKLTYICLEVIRWRKWMKYIIKHFQKIRFIWNFLYQSYTFLKYYIPTEDVKLLEMFTIRVLHFGIHYWYIPKFSFFHGSPPLHECKSFE